MAQTVKKSDTFSVIRGNGHCKQIRNIAPNHHSSAILTIILDIQIILDLWNAHGRILHNTKTDFVLKSSMYDKQHTVETEALWALSQSVVAHFSSALLPGAPIPATFCSHLGNQLVLPPVHTLQELHLKSVPFTTKLFVLACVSFTLMQWSHW